MKTRLLIGMLAFCMAAGMIALPAWSDEPSVDQKKEYYLKCINAEIDNYGCKVGLSASRSKNLKSYGESAARRTEFLTANKEALAQEMAAKGVSLRPHAVHQYLRQRFYEAQQIEMATLKP